MADEPRGEYGDEPFGGAVSPKERVGSNYVIFCVQCRNIFAPIEDEICPNCGLDASKTKVEKR